MSYSAKSYMHLVVCRRAEVMQDLYRHGIEAWAEEDMMPPVTTVMKRSAELARAGRTGLVLPLSGDGHPPIEGNPEFAINKLILEPQLEYLRETAFFTIFKTLIIIDDIGCAIKYRRRMKEAGITQVYAFVGRRDRDTLSSEGIMRATKVPGPQLG